MGQTVCLEKMKYVQVGNDHQSKRMILEAGLSKIGPWRVIDVIELPELINGQTHMIYITSIFLYWCDPFLDHES